MDLVKTIYNALEPFSSELVVVSSAKAFLEVVFIICGPPAGLLTAFVSLLVYSFQPMTGFSM